jgi:hypothetical protein
MDDLDLMILGAINSLSPMSFVGAIEVNEAVKLDKRELGDRIMLLKRSGHVDIITKDYVSSTTLPNFIARVKLTDLGQDVLKEMRLQPKRASSARKLRQKNDRKKF